MCLWPNGAATGEWRTPSGQVPAGYIVEDRKIKQIRTGNASRLSANREGIALITERIGMGCGLVVDLTPQFLWVSTVEVPVSCYKKFNPV